jgi:hypothetical protein
MLFQLSDPVRHVIACQAANVALMLEPMLSGLRERSLVINCHGLRDDVGSTSAAHATTSRGLDPCGSGRSWRMHIAGNRRRYGGPCRDIAGDGRPAASAAARDRRPAASDAQADPARGTFGYHGAATRLAGDRSGSCDQTDRRRHRGMAGRADRAQGCAAGDDLALRRARLRSRHLLLP